MYPRWLICATPESSVGYLHLCISGCSLLWCSAVSGWRLPNAAALPGAVRDVGYSLRIGPALAILQLRAEFFPLAPLCSCFPFPEVFVRRSAELQVWQSKS